MKSIRLLDLGLVPPIRLQTIYHAAGYPLTPDSSGTINSGSPDRPAGDFTVFPAAAAAALQEAAYGAEPARAALIERFAAAYRALAIQSPGVTPEHLTDAVLAATSYGAAQS